MVRVVEDEWLDVLGLPQGSSELASFVESKGIDLANREERRFGNTTLYNLHQEGISFAFTKDQLESVDFFQIDKKFKPVKEELLPFGIMNSTLAKDLVEKFGEPLEKGGGINSKMDIWLRWADLQVEIDDQSWESAKDAKWKSITIFKD